MTLKEFAEAILQLPEEDQGRVLVTDNGYGKLVEVSFDAEYVGPNDLIGLASMGLEKANNVEYYIPAPEDSDPDYDKVSGKVAEIWT